VDEVLRILRQEFADEEAPEGGAPAEI